MIVKVLNGKVVKIYDSIEELPIVNFQKYNKFMLIDSIIGSDVSDVDTLVLKAMKYIKEGDLETAMVQLDNIRQSMHLINQEISPKYLAFTALIYEIDGRKITDLSDNNLKQIQQSLAKEKKNVIDRLLSKFKKKIDTELTVYFPKSQSNRGMKELFNKLKEKVKLELDYLIYGIDNFEAVDKINTELLLSNKPRVFSGSKSFEVITDKQFDELSIIITKNLNVKAKELTVFEFYSALEYIEAENKQKAKLHGH